MDLDDFKLVNDQFGHMTGDELLVAATQRISNLLTSDKQLLARLGGDEFAIILQGVGAKEYVEPILQKVLDNVSAEVVLELFEH